MKKLLYILGFLLLGLASVAQESFDPRKIFKPVPNQLVNDYTNTLTPDQVRALEAKLVAFDDSTSTQIAVVLIPTLDGMDVADYNVELGRAWGVGGKEFSNGVVLLIAKGDRKLNIATGYGVEGALPDITAKHIIDDIIVPNLKGEDYYRGIEEGTDAIIKAVKGEYTAPKDYRKKKSTGGTRIGFIVILIVLFLLFSGGRGGKGGSFMSRRGAVPFILGSLLGGGGGSSGSGWGGGGSSGGGGFGGFGGGSFGGGGASGSW
jgi:uncharacterized protein